MNKLVTMNDMLSDAEKRGYAVGAFNISDLAGVQAITQAAEEEASPVIMQVYTGGIDVMGPRYVRAIAEAAAESSSVPMALHLDHGRDLEEVEDCIQAGFSSVMIDGSKLPLDENIQLTRKAIEMARAAGVSIEAELGKIWFGTQEVSETDREKFLTDPEEARKFVAETGVDALALSIGSAHGLHKFKPRLALDRLEEIRRLTGKTHLVLHGGSDLPVRRIDSPISTGVRGRLKAAVVVEIRPDLNVEMRIGRQLREERLAIARDERLNDAQSHLRPRTPM